MKNIHVIKTDKASRLHKYDFDGFALSKEALNWKEAKNIYITSDEEIKEGDWFLDDNNQISHSYRLSHVKFANPKKIILTTDQDLIKDGIQEIPDEFLEWFVKNPSCDVVEVVFACRGLDGNTTIGEYRVIIQKEEPKTTGDIGVDYALAQSKAIQKSMHLDAEIAYKSLSKQETLEEVAERLYSGVYRQFERMLFIKGAKWQQEQILDFLYSEITERRDYSASKMCEKVIEFIEQFKNK